MSNMIIRTLPEFHRLSREDRLFAVIDQRLEYLHPVEPIESPLVDIREHLTPGLILSPELPVPLTRKLVAEQLHEAAGYFHTRGYMLCIRELYRPIEQQRKEFNELKEEFRDLYPSLNESELYDELTKYIADPDLAPPHSTG